jgi:aminopeptidase N
MLWPNRNDPSGFTAAMNDLYAYAVANALGPAVVDKPADLFSDRTYVRGALTLYALRLTVGDPTFYSILRHFVQDNKGGNVTSRDFIDTAARVSGNSSVRTLLQSWLYGAALPNLPGAAARVAAGKVRPLTIVGRCGRDGARCAQ